MLGLALGLGLASGLIALMRGSACRSATLHVSAGAAIAAVVIGIVVTLAGAFWPARRAGRVSPIRAVLGDARRAPRGPEARGSSSALALFLPGALLGGRSGSAATASGAAWRPIGGIALTMAMFVGMAIAAPFVILPLIRWLAVPLRRLLPTGGRLAADALLVEPAAHRGDRRRR